MNRLTFVRVIHSGLCSTIQDSGRAGYRHLGIPISGAMDLLSHEVANRLVGNPVAAATLEMTLTGDELEWQCDSVIAVTGADLRAVVSRRGFSEVSEFRFAQNRPIRVSAGTRIRFDRVVRGCRAYLAVAGGFQVPEVLGSRSTALRSGFGGISGRRLQSGDELPVFCPSIDMDPEPPAIGSLGTDHPTWFLRPLDLPDESTTLRVLPGNDLLSLDTESRIRVFREEFLVSASSDRMAYRLIPSEASSLTIRSVDTILSAGTVPGTIQLPPGGHPILLMADSAPTGGYPVVGQVITADLPRAAQVRPGQRIRFLPCTPDEAVCRLKNQRQNVERAFQMARLRMASGSY